MIGARGLGARLPAVALAFAAGCGRIGFDPIDTAGFVGFDGFGEVACHVPVVVTTQLTTVAGEFAVASTPAGLAIAFLVPSASEVVVVEIDARGQMIRGPFTMVGSDDRQANGGPSIAWNGSELVVLRSLAPITAPPGNVVVTTIAQDGMQSSTTISTLGFFASSGVDIASDGVSFGAVWVATFPESGAWFAPIAADGTRTTTGAGTEPGNDCPCTPELVFAQGAWTVVFDNDGFANHVDPGHGIGFSRFAGDGTLVGSTLLVSPSNTDNFAPRIAWNGSLHGLAYAGGAPASKVDLGSVDVAGAAVQTAERDGTRYDIAAFDSAFIAAVFDGTALALWPLGADVVPVADPTPVVDTSSVDEVRLAELAGGIAIVWRSGSKLELTRLGCN